MNVSQVIPGLDGKTHLKNVRKPVLTQTVAIFSFTVQKWIQKNATGKKPRVPTVPMVGKKINTTSMKYQVSDVENFPVHSESNDE